MIGRRAPHDIWVHIAGIDIVRVDDEYVLRAGGQRPHAVRRLLHAGESRSDDAAAARPVRAPPRRAGRRLSRRAARLPALGRARIATGGEATIVAADAGRLQFRLLRAFVPRRQARRRTGRGPRPVRRGRPGLHAHDAGAAPRRRDLSPRRRRFSRSAGVQSGLRAGRARPGRRLFGGQCDDRQCSRDRRRRRQGDLQLRPRPHPLLSLRGAAAEERADLPLPRARRAQIRAGAPRSTGGQGGQRLRRLRDAGRPARERRRSASSSPPRSRPIPTITSPSRRWRCRPARPRSRAASRRAMSTCGRSCCPARTGCASSPAASPAWR